MKHPRILLVDDDALFLLAHREELEAAGCRVRTARDGEGALAAAREEEFEIAFVDLVMPGMDGIETRRKLRNIRPRAEVVLLTGFPPHLNPALDELPDKEKPRTLKKPLREDELVRAVEEVMGSRQ